MRIIAAILLAALVSACDQLPMEDVTSAERTETVTSIGTVREIDRENRRFQLRIDGNLLTLRANEAVRAFDIMEVGDRVRVTYTEAIAVNMAMPDDTGEWRSQSAQGVFAGEGSIGRGGAAMVSGVFEFLSYDSATNSATLVSPEGNVLVVDVAPEMRAFAQSRSPGDRILISYAFANAIELELTEPS